MNKKIDFKSLIIPIVIGIGACVGAIMDNQKNKKIDELIEKVDSLNEASEEDE